MPPDELTEEQPVPPADLPDRRRTADTPSMTASVIIVVVAAIVCAVAGYVVTTLLPARYSVSAKVLVQPDPTLSDSAPALTSIDQNDIYVQSQVEAIQSLPLHGVPNTSVTVTQVGLTNVLEISAEADSAANAIAAANTVLDRYLSQRRAQVRSYANGALLQIDKQLVSDSQELHSLTGSGPAISAQRNALSNDYGRLVSLKHQITLAANTAQPTTILHRAGTEDVTQVSSKSRNAALAGLVGALIAILVLASVRRSRARRRLADPRSSQR